VIGKALSLKLNDSDRNQFVATRFTLARNFDDFLRDAPRKMSLVSESDSDAEPIDAKDPETGRFLNRQAFANDSVDLWNTRVPLAQWLAAANGTKLPRNLRTDLARTGWVRSAMLNRTDDARAFLTLWQRLDSSSAKPALPYLESSVPYTTALILLRNPGLAPALREGFGRLTKTARMDEFRDNWWCAETPRKNRLKIPGFLPQKPIPEALALNRSASDFIPTEIVRYAKEHPDDPVVPEALAQSLKVAHYSGCDGPSAGAPSRQAFDLLKSRYGTTRWAQQNRYWYR